MRIFLSYASEQKADAETIAFALRKRGHHVFLDKDDLPPGKSYDDQIQKAVFATDLMIFLISPQSVTKGRYTLTELEYARHRWRTPHNVVLPVMLTPTDMATVPGFLKAVAIHEPKGNLAAEVAFWIEQMRGAAYVTRVVGWFALAGIVTGLAFWGTTLGGFLRSVFGPLDIPLIDAAFAYLVQLPGIGTILSAAEIKGLLPIKMMRYGVIALVTMMAVAVALWRLSATPGVRAALATLPILAATAAGFHAGDLVYSARIAQYDGIKNLRGELANAQLTIAALEQQVDELRRRLGGAAATAPREPNASGQSLALDRALDLEWSYLRLQIGALYGAIFAAGVAGAGSVASLTLHSSRRWMLLMLAGAVVAGLSYGILNSLGISFFLLHTATIALLGYWIARGQE